MEVSYRNATRELYASERTRGMFFFFFFCLFFKFLCRCFQIASIASSSSCDSSSLTGNLEGVRLCWSLKCWGRQYFHTATLFGGQRGHSTGTLVHGEFFLYCDALEYLNHTRFGHVERSISTPTLRFSPLPFLRKIWHIGDGRPQSPHTSSLLNMAGL